MGTLRIITLEVDLESRVEKVKSIGLCVVTDEAFREEFNDAGWFLGEGMQSDWGYSSGYANNPELSDMCEPRGRRAYVLPDGLPKKSYKQVFDLLKQYAEEWVASRQQPKNEDIGLHSPIVVDICT